MSQGFGTPGDLRSQDQITGNFVPQGYQITMSAICRVMAVNDYACTGTCVRMHLQKVQVALLLLCCVVQMEAEGSTSVAGEVVEDVPCDLEASQDAVNEHWSGAVAEGCKEFSGRKNYSIDMAKEKKRNFRRGHKTLWFMKEDCTMRKVVPLGWHLPTEMSSSVCFRSVQQFSNKTSNNEKGLR